MGKRFKHRQQRKREWQQRPPVFRPKRLPLDPAARLIKVFVEGYEDVSFWRSIFDDFETEVLKFEVNVPDRADLAKGKKVLISMIDNIDPAKKDTLLCMDSDFDYLFGDQTEQSRQVNNTPFLLHTYAYSTENLACYAPTLHEVCVKATKNDTRIFDFERFLTEYSRIIYPLFVWYAYSAQLNDKNIFTLIDFKSHVKINYLEVENNGMETLEWLQRQVDRKLHSLEINYSENHAPNWIHDKARFEAGMVSRGLSPDNAYLFMQGHTLMDNVVTVMLHSVCENLKTMVNDRIAVSTKHGVALRNESSNYNNALRTVRDILLDNDNYKRCFLYLKLREDIERFIASL